MKNSRRGFISKAGALSVGMFAYGATQNALAGATKEAISEDDVLVAMPGELFYAIPNDDLNQYAVTKDLFTEEENRRLEASADIVERGKKRRPPRSAAMGIRG